MKLTNSVKGLKFGKLRPPSAKVTKLSFPALSMAGGHSPGVPGVPPGGSFVLFPVCISWLSSSVFPTLQGRVTSDFSVTSIRLLPVLFLERRSNHGRPGSSPSPPPVARHRVGGTWGESVGRISERRGAKAAAQRHHDGPPHTTGTHQARSDVSCPVAGRWQRCSSQAFWGSTRVGGCKGVLKSPPLTERSHRLCSCLRNGREGCGGATSVIYQLSKSVVYATLRTVLQLNFVGACVRIRHLPCSPGQSHSILVLTASGSGFCPVMGKASPILAPPVVLTTFGPLCFQVNFSLSSSRSLKVKTTTHSRLLL